MRNILFTCLLALVCACSGRQTPPCEARAHVIPAPQDVAMYQINPRVFAPQNAFNAVTDRLDSIRALGINVIWFMPINEVGVERSVNSPYCVKNYKAVNAEFGTLADFKNVVTQAHARGLSVIIDWVPNHTSWDNAWVTAHPDWYTHDADGNIISPPGTGWLDVADLNFDNPHMRLAMIDAMKFWVNETGIDGFRCDAVDFVPFDFLKQAVDSLRAMPQDLLLLAEGKRRDHFLAGFDMNYGWDFLEEVRSVFLKGAPATDILHVNRAEYDTIPAGKVKLRFTTNHDETMKMSPLEEFNGERGSMAALVPTLYLNGGALIYGSQEVGYPQRIDFFRYTDVDWQANPALRGEYQKLLHLYNHHAALRKGQLREYPDVNVLLFEKYDAKERFLLAVNVRNAEQEIVMPQAWTNQTCIDAMTGQALQTTDKQLLAPYQYRILQKK